jgi:hypothetical protein
MTSQAKQTPETTDQAPARRWTKPEVRTVGTVGEILKAGTGKTSVTKDPMEPVGFEGPNS